MNITSQTSGVFTDHANAGAIALVTGGGTGIGAATAELLAATGARVAICGRRTEPLDETRRRIEAAGGECLTVETDVRKPEQVESLVAAVQDRFGGIDILINNAGGQFVAPAQDISPNGWRAVHALNVDAVWDVTRSVARAAMIPASRGFIGFVGFSPRRGMPGFAHACSARAAIENLCFTLSQEWSQFGIRTAYLAVGSIGTQGIDQYGPEHAERMKRTVPLGRLGTAEDVAGAICFLASPAASYITGASLTVDGGLDAWGRGELPPEQASEPV